MLVLSRKLDETITIGDDITIRVVDIRGDKVRLGINAPRDIVILRHNTKVLTRKCSNGSGTDCLQAD